MFVHLHTHSCYSFLRGLPSPAELARAAADQKMPALALTDRRGLSGAVEFYTACREAGVQPILGLELEVALPPEAPALLSGWNEARGATGTLVLLAAGRSGWTSLCRLSSALHQELEPQPVFLESLAENSAGLLCLTGGREGWAGRLAAARQEPAAARYLQLLGELFPGRLYVEVQKHSPEDSVVALRLASLARRLKLPLVATHDVHYLAPGGAGLQRLVSAIRLNVPLDSLPESASAPPGAYFTTAEEMADRFAELPVALTNTLEVAERCRLELPLGVPHYPELDLPPGLSPRLALRRDAEAGARRYYAGQAAPSNGPVEGEAEEPDLPPQVRARLDHELAVIAECGYESLFLMMAKIVGFARGEGIPISSRGSAASSLVAHCLGITSPDPIRLNLYFERFLNPARATPPDIDTDLCSRRRDEVIRFVYRTYGQERVAMVGTVNRFRRRSALRETAKAYGLPPAEIKAMVAGLARWRPHHQPQAVKDAPFGELAGRYSTPLHQKLFSEAAALLGLPRHLSVHAGGVVIAPGPMTDLVPTQLAPKGMVITQFDLDSIAALGLVKIDLLGIRGLTVLGDVAAAIQSPLSFPSSFSSPPAQNSQNRLLDPLDSIPEDDPLTSELVRDARTIGCFQIESPGMRATLKEIQARSVDDLMVALALYRPGPLTGGLKDAFVRRHRGEEPVSQLHPALTPLLADTYGVILYQEQVLRIAHELAGLSLADADLLRRAMSHFDPGERMHTLQEKFVAGARERAGVPEEVATRVWELMAAFAGYGFPKAHAASYAQVAWRGAWCKAHHPAIFMAAVLANWGGYYPQRVYLTEVRRMGLTLRPPHVNHARREFGLVYLDGRPVLFMGLDQVRDLTRRTQARILKERPFHSLADFLARADPRPGEAENLVRAGALEGLGAIPALLRQLGGGWPRGQLKLFSMDLDAGEEWSLPERVAAQEEVLGVGVDAHPLELVTGQIEEAGALTTLEAASRTGGRVRVAGVPQSWTRTSGSRRDFVYLMSLEDLEGMLEVMIAGEVYRRHSPALASDNPIVVEGVVELNHETGEPAIRAEKIWKI